METLIRLASVEECTGCMACHDACSTGSISFEYKGLHKYPVIKSNTCIKCGKCVQVCPPLCIGKQVQQEQDVYTPEYLCAWNEDEAERFHATSGGVGGALAKHALSMGWYVCGAAFDDGWKLSHIVSNDSSILDKIRGSKYLQSDMTGVYKEISSLLKQGEKVLFIGTPCQTSGLRNLIPVSCNENLFTCEIICHGVNSPLVWDGYKEYIEEKHQTKLATYNFRSKSKGWGKLRASYTFQNGKKVDEPGYRNIFHSWFGQHYMMRESCFRCKFRTADRYSDIIIGDFWGIEKVEPSLNVKDGASVLIVNSEKAKSFVAGLNVWTKCIDGNIAKLVLLGFEDKMPEDIKRKQVARMKKFEVDYQIHKFVDVVAKLYPPTTPFERILNSILFHLHLKK